MKLLVVCVTFRLFCRLSRCSCMVVTWFLPFHGIVSGMLYEIKCKQDEDKGKEGRMSSVGDSNLLCHLLYMAFITTTNVGGKKKKQLDTARWQKRSSMCKSRQHTVVYLKTSIYTLASTSRVKDTRKHSCSGSTLMNASCFLWPHTCLALFVYLDKEIKRYPTHGQRRR